MAALCSRAPRGHVQIFKMSLAVVVMCGETVEKISSIYSYFRRGDELVNRRGDEHVRHGGARLVRADGSQFALADRSSSSRRVRLLNLEGAT